MKGFKKGDLIIGLPEASYYGITKQGWKGTVVSDEDAIGNFQATDNRDGCRYDIHSKYFTLDTPSIQEPIIFN